MKARVTVTLKSGILDPQGKAIEGALKSLGIAGVASVRQGKVFDIEIEGSDRAKAEAALRQAADRLLANTVIENYIKTNPEKITQSLHIISTIRKLERSGDQIKNVAEEIIFYIEAKVLKHLSAEKSDE